VGAVVLSGRRVDNRYLFAIGRVCGDTEEVEAADYDQGRRAPPAEANPP
jgi:hypothetical protein